MPEQFHDQQQVLSPRRNRVDPWGDFHAVAARGMLTGNRGCVVDDHERVVRHHSGTLWISCLTAFRGWRWPLARARRWTPLFFLDEAVALAAGHRPCASCRRTDYLAYRDAVTHAVQAPSPLRAFELNERLNQERLRSGRGMLRAGDRILWSAPVANLPDGTMVVNSEGQCELVHGDFLRRFTFTAWTTRTPRPSHGVAAVLTPPTSVMALANGYRPILHPSAFG